MMNWLLKISTKDLIKEIKLRGWEEDQLHADGLAIFKDGDNWFFSLGDWAKTDPEDVIGAIKYIQPDSTVEWDYEAGPGDGNWTKVCSASKCASNDYYEAVVLKELQRYGFNDAIEEIKERGPHGMELWTLFKDQFEENTQLFRKWLEDRRRLTQPKYEGMSAVDQWAEKARGIGSALNSYVDKGPLEHHQKRRVDPRGRGGVGYNRKRRG